MQVFINSRPELKADQRIAAALGTFDGLHLGHRALIDELKKVAEAEGLSTLAYTFTSVPSELFGKHKAGMRLFTLDEKIKAFEKLDIDYLVLMDFDRAYAAIPEDAFIKSLKDSFNIAYLVVGYNFTYGKNAQGDAVTLQKEAASYGFKADIIAPVLLNGLPVSSSRVREALLSGAVEDAAAMLGTSYAITGTVVEGKRIGRNLGYPTINIKYEKAKLLPKNGVYFTRAKVAGRYHESITNIGFNPTVSDGSLVSLETHILDFEKAVYGETVKVAFEKRLRDEIKFPNREMLKQQIEKDIASASEYFGI